MKKINPGYILFSIITLLLIISGIQPVDRFTWCLEIVWVFAGLLLCVFCKIRKIRISVILQFALFLHALVLIYGGYYTYEKVPLGEYMKQTFTFTRNNYDRIGHFAQGFFPALLYREVLFRNSAAKGWWLEVFVFAMCMMFTALFELIEFGSAMAFGSGADAFLGSQGDIWDAQWDMLYCGIGAIVSIMLLRKLHIKYLTQSVLFNKKEDSYRR